MISGANVLENSRQSFACFKIWHLKMALKQNHVSLFLFISLSFISFTNCIIPHSYIWELTLPYHRMYGHVQPQQLLKSSGMQLAPNGHEQLISFTGVKRLLSSIRSSYRRWKYQIFAKQNKTKKHLRINNIYTLYNAFTDFTWEYPLPQTKS